MTPAVAIPAQASGRPAVPEFASIRQCALAAANRLRRAGTLGRIDPDLRKAQIAALRQHRLEEREILHRLAGIAEAAERGDFQLLLERFPSDLCTDSGRALNNQEEDWPKTLDGVPLQLYRYWQQELHTLGYGITAFILEYPDGMPGDAGLFLTWR